MNIKLIPVIEIYRASDKVVAPEKGPYWEYADEWEEYNHQSLKENGFSKISSYAKGSNLYELSNINNKDLLLQIRNRTEGWELDEICPFDGGYILNVDERDLLFPQCCSDLGDIASWKLLADGDRYGLWEGHPLPIITVNKDLIRFDLTVGEFEECFQPKPIEEVFTIDRLALKDAVLHLMDNMKQFAKRLNSINTQENLGFKNLDEILIGKYK